jgi:starch synthase
VTLHRRAADWQRLMARAMAQDCSWDGPAAQYLALYRAAIESRLAAPRGVPPGA